MLTWDPMFVCTKNFLKGAFPSETPPARFWLTLLFRAGGANLTLSQDTAALPALITEHHELKTGFPQAYVRRCNHGWRGALFDMGASPRTND
jgi:hypothetical protein